MAHVIEDEILVCDECAVTIANDDYSDIEPEHRARVLAGIACLNQRGYPVIDYDFGFSWKPCQCCGSLAGYRHSVALLGD